MYASKSLGDIEDLFKIGKELLPSLTDVGKTLYGSYAKIRVAEAQSEANLQRSQLALQIEQAKMMTPAPGLLSGIESGPIMMLIGGAVLFFLIKR